MRLGRTQALASASAALLIFLACSQATDPTSGRLVVIGSESVWRAMDSEAREFMAMYGKAVVRAVGVGSEAGLKALFEAPVGKETLLAVSTRALTESEMAAATKQGWEPRQYRIALDGIAIIVNAANPVDELTLGQVRRLFSGQVRNWRELGGPDLPVRVIFGKPNSATYGYLRDSLLGETGLAPETQHFDSMYRIIEEVARDKGAIGYCSSSLLYRDWLAKPPNPEPGIRALSLGRDSTGPFVAPDPGTVYDKSYPLVRYVYVCSRHQPKGITSGFVTFLMSSKGQQVLARDGLAPATVKFIVKRDSE
ncbi:MAG: PstS family phosphate ABC transporter substrate-binding protein [candidate division WOR-3 bacterium]